MNFFNFRQNLYYVFSLCVDGDGNEIFDFSGAYTTEAKAVKSLPEGATIYRDEVPIKVFDDQRYSKDRSNNYLILRAPVDTKVDLLSWIS